MKLSSADVVGEINKMKYLKAPTIKELSDFIESLDIFDQQFERFFGIPYNTITQIRKGQRELPAKYWHFVYENIVPAYGVGFEYEEKMQRKIKRLESQPKKTVKSKSTILPQTSDILQKRINGG